MARRDDLEALFRNPSPQAAMKLHILLLAFGVTGDTDESRQLQGSPGGGYPGDDGLGGGYGDDEDVDRRDRSRRGCDVDRPRAKTDVATTCGVGSFASQRPRVVAAATTPLAQVLTINLSYSEGGSISGGWRCHRRGRVAAPPRGATWIFRAHGLSTS